VAGSCELGAESLDFVKGQTFLGQLCGYRFPKILMHGVS
jgi:hypothetical protein